MLKPEQGAFAWLPAENVEPVEEYDYYDIPLCGVVEQGGMHYLFRCIFGEIEKASVWAYAPLTAGAEKDLAKADSPGDFDEVVERCLQDRAVLVALAHECRLLEWSTIDAGQEGHLVLADRFLERMRRWLDKAEQSTHEVEEARELIGC